MKQKSRDLRLIDDGGGGRRFRRKAETAHKRSFVANHQLLNKLLGLGGIAAGVPVDYFYLAAAGDVAMLRKIGFDALSPVCSHHRVVAGHRTDNTHSDGLLRRRQVTRAQESGSRQSCETQQ